MTLENSIRARNHSIGIFAIAFAVLAYQVLLTRLFSVTLYYHFAFAGVTLVMLGLTVGAERVYLFESRARLFHQQRRAGALVSLCLFDRAAGLCAPGAIAHLDPVRHSVHL